MVCARGARGTGNARYRHLRNAAAHLQLLRPAVKGRRPLLFLSHSLWNNSTTPSHVGHPVPVTCCYPYVVAKATESFATAAATAAAAAAAAATSY